MTTKLKGCIERFFYHPTENYIRFMFRDEDKMYKINIPPNYKDSYSFELTNTNDIVELEYSQYTMIDEPTLTYWNNGALSHILKK